MTSVVIATPDERFASRVRAALGTALATSNGEVVHFGESFSGRSPYRFLDDLVATQVTPPDVIALGPGIATLDALELARQIDETHPEINVVLITQVGEGVLERALRAGVRDVLSPDASDAEIGLALKRAVESASRRRGVLMGGSSDKDPGDKRVITVISPKGGSGKTTVATNLAVGLAGVNRGEAVLIDLDLTFGDVASALRLVPEHTLADVLGSDGHLDPMSMKVLLTPHDSSGLFVLCAPDSPAQGEQISVAQSETVVRFAKGEFPHVVIDTSAGLDDHTLAALELSTDILLLCTMDVPSVRSLRKVVDALNQLGMTKQQRHFVLNRAHTKVGLATEDIERTVGMPVDIAVDSSREVPLSMNEGVPLIAGELRSPVARQLRELVSRFSDQPVGARRSGLFERWRQS